MNKKIYRIAIIAILLFSVLPASLSAKEFMDKRAPKHAIECGLRFGITSSGMKTDLNGYSTKNGSNWGTGFAVGGVVNLNMRNYISIQPGFFFENRSYDFTTILHDPQRQSLTNNIGHTRNYTFSFPILASMHFNLSNTIAWNVDFGPYFNWGVGGKYDLETIQTEVSPELNGSNKYNHVSESHDYYGENKWQHKKFDWGIKCGTGLTIREHYSIYFHYMLGLKDISACREWDKHTRGYTISIGYDF